MPAVETAECAFPTLNESELEQLASLATLEEHVENTTLIEAGDVDYDFYVVLKGAVEILDDTTREARRIALHHEGEFTGDVDMLLRRPAVFDAVTREPSRLLKVSAKDLRRVLAEIPTLSDKLLNAFQVRRDLLQQSSFAGVRVVGDDDSSETLRIREFLHKNSIPSTWLDAEKDEGKACLQELGRSQKDLPLVACNENTVLVQPTLLDLAKCLKMRRRIENRTVDLAVVGAGPAGLAAAVYSASEGLKTLLLDALGPGGQAGASSKIENFIGFPSGLSGVELANRAMLQLYKFGGAFSVPVMVESLRQEDEFHVLACGEGEELRARAVVVATGARYRRLTVPGCKRYEGKGVYYSATSVESCLCEQQQIIVIGGGNSAGQAAMYLSESAGKVIMLVREGSLDEKMSAYLHKRLEKNGKIEIRCDQEIDEVCGDGRIAQVKVHNSRTNEADSLECDSLFVFTGAQPNSEWLPDSIGRDERGFVKVGADAGGSDIWPLERAPFALETTVPGIFGAGDIRAGATSRVGFAAGDGALAVTCVHQYLASLES